MTAATISSARPLALRIAQAIRGWSWMTKAYAVTVMIVACVFAYGGMNIWRAERYESFRRQLASAGWRAPRANPQVDREHRARLLAASGDFSGVVIEAVRIDGPRLTAGEDALCRLREFPEISSVQMRMLELDYQRCRWLWQTPHLQHLRLSNCRLDDECLVGIENCRQLVYLNLDSTAISDQSVERLAKLTSLTDLKLEDTDITAAGAARLVRALPKATVVHSTSPAPKHRDALFPLARAGAAVRTDPARGTELTLSASSWRGGDAELRLTRDLHNLQQVNLDQVAVTPSLLTALGNLPELRSISFSGMKLAHHDLVSLAAAPKLERMRWNDVDVTQLGPASLSKLENLQSLAVSGGKLPVQSAAALAGLPHLRSLALRSLKIEGGSVAEFLASLADSPSLQQLEIMGLAMNDEDTRPLARFVALRSLSLQRTSITDAATPHLRAIPGLLQINLGETQVTLQGAEQLQTALPNCRIVHSGIRRRPLDLETLLKNAGQAASSGGNSAP